jgi:hypothetical protein
MTAVLAGAERRTPVGPHRFASSRSRVESSSSLFATFVVLLQLVKKS